jgi:hypothetical protein
MNPKAERPFPLKDFSDSGQLRENMKNITKGSHRMWTKTIFANFRV